MCSAPRARPARPVRPALQGGHVLHGRRATAPARPVNNEGHQDQSAADNPNGTGADRGPTRPPGSPRRTSQRPAVPPDDRLTTILPPVRDDRPDHLRDPIEAVKAALGGRSSDRDPERDPLEMATAALEGQGAPAPPAADRWAAGRTPAAAGLGLATADRLEPAGPHQLDVGPTRALRQRRGDPAAADRHLRDGLLHRRHSQARRYPHQPGVDNPGQRRLRAGQNRSARRQSSGRQHRPGARACAPGGDRGRGPQLLFQPRLLVHRLRTRDQEQHLRRRHPGRLDDHPAVRQERVGRSAARRNRRPGAQGQRARHRHQDVGGVVQGRRAAGLPQHHLLRPRRLRDLRSLDGLFRQTRRATHRGRRGAAGRADPAPVDAGPCGGPRRCHRTDGTGCSTEWWKSRRCRRQTVQRNCFHQRFRPSRPAHETRRPDPTG